VEAESPREQQSQSCTQRIPNLALQFQNQPQRFPNLALQNPNRFINKFNALGESKAELPQRLSSDLVDTGLMMDYSTDSDFRKENVVNSAGPRVFFRRRPLA
jgi:hypothetical protein